MESIQVEVPLESIDQKPEAYIATFVMNFCGVE